MSSKNANKNKKQPTLTINGPTLLTAIRMILAALVFFFALNVESWAKIVALILFIIAAVTDKLDGVWARKKNLVTDLGSFLDPIADKMLVNLSFLVLTYIHAIPIWVFAIILVRDLMVDGVRMTLARNGKTIAASNCGKFKTAFQMAAIIFFLLNNIVNNGVLYVISNIILYIALILTVISGIQYLSDLFKVNSEE